MVNTETGRLRDSEGIDNKFSIPFLRLSVSAFNPLKPYYAPQYPLSVTPEHLTNVTLP